MRLAIVIAHPASTQPRETLKIRSEWRFPRMRQILKEDMTLSPKENVALLYVLVVAPSALGRSHGSQ